MLLLLLPLHERVRKNRNEEVDTITPTKPLYCWTMLPNSTSCDCMANGRTDSRVTAVNSHKGDTSISWSFSDPLVFSPLWHLNSLSLHSLCCQSGSSLSQFCFVCLFRSFFYSDKKDQYSQFWVSICICHWLSVCLFVPRQCFTTYPVYYFSFVLCPGCHGRRKWPPTSSECKHAPWWSSL